MRGRWLLMGALAAMAACRDGTGNEPGALEIVAASEELTEGQTLALAVRSGGREVPPGSVEWQSRDGSTLTVAAGVVRGVAPGVAWVVARSGSLVDSVRVTVRFSSLAPHSVAARIGTSASSVVRLGGVALRRDLPTDPVRSSYVLFGATADADASPAEVMDSDSLLHFRLLGAVAPGSYTLPPAVIEFDRENWTVGFGGAGGQHGVQIWVKAGDYRRRAYFPATEARVEVRVITLPAAAGWETGVLVGSIAFQAAGFELEFPPGGGPMGVRPLGGETVPVYAEFTLPLYWKVASLSRLTLNGGGFADTAWVGGQASLGSAGVDLHYMGVIRPDSASRRMIDLRSRIPAALGRVTLPEASGSLITGSEATPAPWVWTAFHPLDAQWQPLAPDHALSRAGFAEVQSFVAPTARSYGRIGGRIESAQGFWSVDRYLDRTTQMALAFDMAITPLDGEPYPGW